MKMGIYEELVARGLIAQVTNEEEIKNLVNNGKATFYIGFDPTADSLHVGHFMALCLMKRLQMAGNKPIALIGGAGDSDHMPSTELTADELADGKLDLMTLLVKTGLCTTKSDARRNIQQGGVTVDDEKVTDIARTYTEDELKKGIIIRRGKKNFNKVILK